MIAARPRSWSIECMIEWLKIREKEGKPFPGSVNELTTELDHSALLQRLMVGKRALKTPPPLSFAHPWYELIEKGVAHPSEVEVMSGALVINSHPWTILQTISAEEYVVSYKDSHKLYHAFMEDVELNGAKVRRWKLEKVIDQPHPASSGK